MAKDIKIRDLQQISKQNHRKNGLISYVICFFSTIFSCGFIALNIIFPTIFLFTVPFVVIPLFFACQISIVLMRDAEQLTLGGYFRCFFGYFGEHFRSTFRVIRSMLFSLIFFGGLLLTLIIVIPSCFYAFNVGGFTDFLNQMPESTLYDSEALLAYLEQHMDVLEFLSMFIYLPPLTVFAFAFIYQIDRNSISLHHRIEYAFYPGKYESTLFCNVIKNNKKAFNKAYFGLNWPFLVLFVIGYGAGAFLGYLFSPSGLIMFTFGLIGAIFLSFVFYGPTLFANKEAIYISFKDEFISEDIVLQNSVSESLKELLDKLAKEENDTKKDSDES